MKEDNTGFINFPNKNSPNVTSLDSGKTLIYLVAFDPKDLTKSPYDISNVRISLPGTFVADDMVQRDAIKSDQSIDELVSNQKNQDKYDIMYFPNINKDEGRIASIHMMSSICIGWSEYSFLIKDNVWFASFRDLTNEGRKLYYSMKKLHNTKEVRILTFNNI